MKDTIICDLDGTLADITHRRHHVQKVDDNGRKKKPDWDAFYAGVKDDTVSDAVWWLLNSTLHHEYESDRPRIIFCSGRPERCRRDTLEWLDAAFDSYFVRHGGDATDFPLYMRKDGDYRADYIVKQEILDAHIDKSRVLFVLDDRQQVVDMWRRNGLVCLQVAPGDF